MERGGKHPPHCAAVCTPPPKKKVYKMTLSLSCLVTLKSTVTKKIPPLNVLKKQGPVQDKNVVFYCIVSLPKNTIFTFLP